MIKIFEFICPLIILFINPNGGDSADRSPHKSRHWVPYNKTPRSSIKTAVLTKRFLMGFFKIGNK